MFLPSHTALITTATTTNASATTTEAATASSPAASTGAATSAPTTTVGSKFAGQSCRSYPAQLFNVQIRYGTFRVPTSCGFQVLVLWTRSVKRSENLLFEMIRLISRYVRKSMFAYVEMLVVVVAECVFN